MTEEALADHLVPIAAELVGTVRDYGPEDVAAVLARVPDGRHDALAVILAAMVDPDARPSELLAWTDCGPVISRGEGIDPIRQVATPGRFPREHGTERGYQQHRHRKEMPACELCRSAHSAHVRARKANAS